MSKQMRRDCTDVLPEEVKLRIRVNAAKSAARQQALGEAARPCQGDFEYEQLKQALIDYYQPENPVEEVLVERIAVLDWRLRRSVLAERKSVHAVPGQEYFIPPVGAMERILQYDRTTDRELHRAIAALEQLRGGSREKSKNKANEAENSGVSRSNGAISTGQVDPAAGSCDPGKGSYDPEKGSCDPGYVTVTEAVLDALFASAVRIKLLRLLLGSTERFYLRELAAKVSLWFGPVQREINRLADAGIVVKEVSGRQTYYRINELCAVVPELRAIFAKTERCSGGRVSSPGG